MSAPSSLIRANANGTSSGCCTVGAATHDHDSTVPAGPTSTKSWASSSAVSGSHSSGGAIHAVAAADADDPPVGERSHEGTHHRPERSPGTGIGWWPGPPLSRGSPLGTSRTELMRGDYVRRPSVCPAVALGRIFTAACAHHRSGVDWWGAPPPDRADLRRRAAVRCSCGAPRCFGSLCSSGCSSRWRRSSRCGASGRSGPGRSRIHLTHILVNSVLTTIVVLVLVIAAAIPFVGCSAHGPRRRPAQRAIALAGGGGRGRELLGPPARRTACRSCGASTRCTTASSRWTGSRRSPPSARPGVHPGVHRAPAGIARLRGRRVRRRGGVHHAARTLPACQRTAALPRRAVGDQHPGVAPLAPRDPRRRGRQELRPAASTSCSAPCTGRRGHGRSDRDDLAGVLADAEPAPPRVPVRYRRQGSRGPRWAL